MRGLGSGEPAGPSITLSQHVLVLSLDTSTRAGSAALVEDGVIRHEIIGDESRTHGERLPRDLMRVLDEAGPYARRHRSPRGHHRTRIVHRPARRNCGSTGSGHGHRAHDRAGLCVRSAGCGRRRRNVARRRLGRRAKGRSLCVAARRGRTTDCRAVIACRRSPRWSAGNQRSTARAVRMIGDGAVRYESVVAERLHDRARIIPPPPFAGIAGRIAARATGARGAAARDRSHLRAAFGRRAGATPPRPLNHGS